MTIEACESRLLCSSSPLDSTFAVGGRLDIRIKGIAPHLVALQPTANDGFVATVENGDRTIIGRYDAHGIVQPFSNGEELLGTKGITDRPPAVDSNTGLIAIPVFDHKQLPRSNQIVMVPGIQDQNAAAHRFRVPQLAYVDRIKFDQQSRLLVLGRDRTYTPRLLRFNIDGTLDSTFNAPLIARLQTNDRSTPIPWSDLIVEAGGKIVVALCDVYTFRDLPDESGYQDTVVRGRMRMLRLLANGETDTIFGPSSDVGQDLAHTVTVEPVLSEWLGVRTLLATDDGYLISLANDWGISHQYVAEPTTYLFRVTRSGNLLNSSQSPATIPGVGDIQDFTNDGKSLIGVGLHANFDGSTTLLMGRFSRGLNPLLEYGRHGYAYLETGAPIQDENTGQVTMHQRDHGALIGYDWADTDRQRIAVVRFRPLANSTSTGSAAVQPSRTLSIIGTSGRDQIDVRRTDGIVRVSINSRVSDARASSLDRIEIHARGKNDLITLGDDLPSALIYGESGNDLIRLGTGTTTQYLNGLNTVHGGSGDDTIVGGNSEDQLWGDSGDDALNGGGNFDVLVGGSGKDTLDGGTSTDTLVGDAMEDVFGRVDDDDWIVNTLPDYLHP